MLAEGLTRGRVINLVTGGRLPLWVTERVKLNSQTQGGSEESLVEGDGRGSIWMGDFEVTWESVISLPCRQLTQWSLGQRSGAGIQVILKDKGKGWEFSWIEG